MVVNVGLDVGYRGTKVVSGSRRAVFASVVGDVSAGRVSLRHANGRIELAKPEAALVGEIAVTQSRFAERREDRAWVTGREWFLLAMAALSEVVPDGYAGTIHICTGLPVMYWDDRELVRQRLMGMHEVQRAGKAAQVYEVRAVRVVPQPWGTLLSCGLDQDGKPADEALLTGRVGIGDGGGHTTNIQTVSLAEEIGAKTFSLEVGGWDLVRALRTWLATNAPGLDLRDHEIDSAIAKGNVNYFGKPLDLKPAIDQAVRPLAAQIVAAMTQAWGTGAGLDAIVLGGGLMIHAARHVQPAFPHARLAGSGPDELVFAVAQGYYNLLQYASVRVS